MTRCPALTAALLGSYLAACGSPSEPTRVTLPSSSPFTPTEYDARTLIGVWRGALVQPSQGPGREPQSSVTITIHQATVGIAARVGGTVTVAGASGTSAGELVGGVLAPSGGVPVLVGTLTVAPGLTLTCLSPQGPGSLTAATLSLVLRIEGNSMTGSWSVPPGPCITAGPLELERQP